jgi:hypothetical protein
MLIRNTLRQDQPNRSASVNAPPSTRPIAEAKPSIAPYKPNALPRSSASNIVRNVPSSCGIIAAAATPCMARAAISSPGLWARPAARLATPNATIPPTKIRLRPRVF